jgi:hypothetical protein
LSEAILDLDLARHGGGAEFNLAGRQAVEHGISMGKCSVWLRLTRNQTYPSAGMGYSFNQLLFHCKYDSSTALKHAV